MMPPRFVTMGDSPYESVLELSADRIREFYPSSMLHVYDVGMKDVNYLNARGNVEIIPWIPYLGEHTYERFHRLMLHKCGIIRRELLAYDGPVVWIDADAFLVKSVDYVFALGVDLVLMGRSDDEVNRREKPHQALNSGVMFCLTDKCLSFMDDWEFNFPVVVPEGNAPGQYALATLLEKNNAGEALYEDYVMAEYHGVEHLRVMTLPNDIYNCFHEEFYEDAKIIHLKALGTTGEWDLERFTREQGLR